MQFKSILSFFKIKNSSTEILVPTIGSDVFTIYLLNNDIDSIENMLSKGYQIKYEEQEILKEKLIELAAYFYPRNFYKKGIIVNNKTKEMIIEKDSLELTDLNLTSEKEEYNQLADLDVTFEQKHLQYFKIICNYNILDDYILEQIQSNSGIGQFFNIIAGINIYYCDEIILKPLNKYNEKFIQTDKIKKEIYTSEENLLIKNKILKKIIYDISKIFEYKYLTNSKIPNSTINFSNINKSVLEQYPISHLNRMSFLAFLNPSTYKSDNSSSEENIFTLRNTPSYNIELTSNITNNDKIIASLNNIYTQLNILSSNIYKRISNNLEKEHFEHTIKTMLEKKYLFSYCMFSNLANNFSKFNSSYDIQKGENILKVVDTIKKRKPHILITDNLINSIESQIQLSNSILKNFNLNKNNSKKEESVNLIEKELINNSKIESEIKQTLLEIVKMRDNIIFNAQLNENELLILSGVSKRIKQIINLSELASDNNDVLDYTHSLYEQVFTFEYSFLKKQKC